MKYTLLILSLAASLSTAQQCENGSRPKAGGWLWFTAPVKCDARGTDPICNYDDDDYHCQSIVGYGPACCTGPNNGCSRHDNCFSCFDNGNGQCSWDNEANLCIEQCLSDDDCRAPDSTCPGTPPAPTPQPLKCADGSDPYERRIGSWFSRETVVAKCTDTSPELCDYQVGSWLSRQRTHCQAIEGHGQYCCTGTNTGCTRHESCIACFNADEGCSWDENVGACVSECFTDDDCREPGGYCPGDEPPETSSPTSTTKSPTTLSPTTKTPTTSPTTKSPTTQSPTKSPTESPTKSPTKSPTTKSPTTRSPTNRPTTKTPTKSPTTKSPTKAPTTPSPTKEPTIPLGPAKCADGSDPYERRIGSWFSRETVVAK